MQEMRERHMRRNEGYTLIEVMTVLALIGIVASIIIPNVIGWLPNYRLRSGAEEIQSALQLARLGAIKQNTSSTVTFDTANHTFLATVSGQTIKRGEMPAGIQIVSITSPLSMIQFNSRGMANDSSGVITVTNNQGKIKTIAVNIVGNSRID
jgi:prepilin-type N-terminal cleavage/methylation domain-containing protein